MNVRERKPGFIHVKFWEFFHLWRLINPKKFKIETLENKFTRKLILFRQSTLFLQSFLLQRLSLTKISNIILTQFQAVLQLYNP